MIKRLFAEFVGTFFIVFGPVALASSGKLPGGDGSLMAAAIVSGVAVLAMIYALGEISGAHFNPAVTLGFAVARRFPLRFVLPYWVAQFSGAIAAAAVSLYLFKSSAGAHMPMSPEDVLRNISVEIAATFMLMFVIMGVATDRRTNPSVPGIAIGLAVFVGVLWAGPLTGGSMNPARSLGPNLFHPDALPTTWLYLIAPPIGAVLAARAYEGLRLHPEHAKNLPS